MLFDLDGVLRHFDPSTAGRVEDLHGLDRGSIEAAAFAPGLLHAVTVGEITNREWVAAIGARIGSAAAAAVWRDQPFVVDTDILAVARDLRDAGLRVSILSNATDGLCAELAGTAVLDVVEQVFNSSELRIAKPAPDAFLAVTEALEVHPTAVVFVDDRVANVEAANALGMVGHHHQGRGGDAADRLRAALRAVGVLTGPAAPT